MFLKNHRVVRGRGLVGEIKVVEMSMLTTAVVEMSTQPAVTITVTTTAPTPPQPAATAPPENEKPPLAHQPAPPQ